MLHEKVSNSGPRLFISKEILYLSEQSKKVLKLAKCYLCASSDFTRQECCSFVQYCCSD